MKGYTGISTREARLAEFLDRAIKQHCPNEKLFCSSCTEAREYLDAKCGTKLMDAWHAGINPCDLPAGHSGQCHAE